MALARLLLVLHELYAVHVLHLFYFVNKIVKSKVIESKIIDPLVNFEHKMDKRGINEQLQEEVKRACDAALQENWQSVELVQRVEQIMNDVLAQNFEDAKSKAAKAIASTLKGKSMEDTKARDMANAILSALGGKKKMNGDGEGTTGSGAGGGTKAKTISPEVLDLLSMPAADKASELPVEYLTMKERDLRLKRLYG